MNPFSKHGSDFFMLFMQSFLLCNCLSQTVYVLSVIASSSIFYIEFVIDYNNEFQLALNLLGLHDDPVYQVVSDPKFITYLVFYNSALWAYSFIIMC